jgi:SAM-dependent methyltransferase
VTGVEISDDGIKVARLAHPALKFIHASVYDDVRQDAGKSFDVALAIEAIEHLYSPRIFLRHAFGLLRPGGMIVTTPYHGYWKSLALSHAGRWDRHFTVGWDGGHIKFFSLRTLRLMLAEQGFVDVRAWYAGRLPYL